MGGFQSNGSEAWLSIRVAVPLQMLSIRSTVKAACRMLILLRSGRASDRLSCLEKRPEQAVRDSTRITSAPRARCHGKKSETSFVHSRRERSLPPKM